MKTYDQWIEAGRGVKQNEKASAWLYNPAHTARRGLFTEEQTEPRVPEQLDGWIYYSKEDAPPLGEKAAKIAGVPVVRVDYDSTTHEVAIWCGPAREIIDQLKSSGYRFRQRDRRWVGKRPDINRVIHGLQGSVENPRADVRAQVDGQFHPTRTAI